MFVALRLERQPVRQPQQIGVVDAVRLLGYPHALLQHSVNAGHDRPTSPDAEAPGEAPEGGAIQRIGQGQPHEVHQRLQCLGPLLLLLGTQQG